MNRNKSGWWLLVIIIVLAIVAVVLIARGISKFYWVGNKWLDGKAWQ